MSLLHFSYSTSRRLTAISSIFGAFNLYFQAHAARTNNKDSISDHADVSATRAIRDFVFFIPGVSEGLLAFVVFGTTRTFRDKLLSLVQPRRTKPPERGSNDNNNSNRMNELIVPKLMNRSMGPRGSNGSNTSNLALGQVSPAFEAHGRDIDGICDTARTNTT